MRFTMAPDITTYNKVMVACFRDYIPITASLALAE